jgi:penicillin-binding protein 2
VADSTPKLSARRVRLIRALSIALFAVLGLRLWHIQFVRGEELRKQAAANRFVAREIEADRGVVYDASGRQVVMNRPRFTVSVVTAALPEDPSAREAVFTRLSDILGIPVRGAPIYSGLAAGSTGLAAGSTGGAAGTNGEAAGNAGVAADTKGEARARAAGSPGLISLLPQDERGNLVISWDAVPIARNVARLEAFELMEASVDLPGVIIGESPVREYPAGPTLSHILGFTGSIPEEELDDYREQGYKIYDIVGRSGLEATYEDVLRGTKGRKWVEVDAMGREIRTVGEPEPPTPGGNLHLTIDLRLQQAAEEALVKGLGSIGARTGAIVALDPRNSAVRALVTWPSYDNNMFATGASPEEFTKLLTHEDRPLVNRAITGQYPPGSVFKIITASAALQEGVIKPNTRIFDPGTIYLPNEYDPEIKYPFQCWLSGGHGNLNVVGALAHSCDVFFYEVAGGYYEDGSNQDGLGSALLAQYARAFGLGAPTQLELLGEASGRVPTKEWLAEWSGMYWGTGQTYIMGIGQGFTLVTPIQMANAVAAVANGGTLNRPHLVESAEGSSRQVEELPDELGTVPVDDDYLALVRQGMRGAVDFGTALRAWTHLPSAISVAGKTGTAEFCDWVVVEPEESDTNSDSESADAADDAGGEGAVGDADDESSSSDDTQDSSVNYNGYCRRDREGHLLTHAWFVAFAPAEEPEIALAVFIDGSGLDHIIEGSRDAAPIAAEVLNAWFDLPPATPTPLPGTGTPSADGEAVQP